MKIIFSHWQFTATRGYSRLQITVLMLLSSITKSIRCVKSLAAATIPTSTSDPDHLEVTAKNWLPVKTKIKSSNITNNSSCSLPGCLQFHVQSQSRAYIPRKWCSHWMKVHYTSDSEDCSACIGPPHYRLGRVDQCSSPPSTWQHNENLVQSEHMKYRMITLVQCTSDTVGDTACMPDIDAQTSTVSTFSLMKCFSYLFIRCSDDWRTSLGL